MGEAGMGAPHGDAAVTQRAILATRARAVRGPRRRRRPPGAGRGARRRPEWTRPGRRSGGNEPVAGHRGHAPRRTHEREHEAGRTCPLQARGLQPRRLGQGPPGAQHDRPGRGAGRPHAGQGDPRAHLRQHRHRHRHDRRREGVSGAACACRSARAPSAVQILQGLRRRVVAHSGQGEYRRRDPRGAQATRARARACTTCPTSTRTRTTSSRTPRPPDRRSSSRRPAKSTTSSPAWAPRARSWAPGGTSSRSSRR